MLNFARQFGAYLLIPVPPTPNGPMHLGHIAGPYLRTDVLARRLRQHGDHAVVYTGTDDNDNYVTLKAAQLGIPAEDVARQFHSRIAQDLRALNIQLGDFVNTLDGDGRSHYRRHMLATMAELKENGFAVDRDERILVDQNTGDAIVGCWITGKCPRCNTGVAGYFCESCGTHFQPEEIRDAVPRRPEAAAQAETISNVFLNIKDQEAHLGLLRKMGVAATAIDIVARFFAIPGNQFRLTVPGAWGVPFYPSSTGFPRSIFSILWEIFVYSDLLATRRGTAPPAYRQGSDTKLVLAFGIDNTIALLVGGVGVVNSLHGCKVPEHALTNYFMNLEGEKFSTSRNHAIWAADIASRMQNRVDAVRYYLCSVSPDTEVTNFSVSAFLDTINNVVGTRMSATVRTALHSAHAARHASALARDEVLIQRFKAAVELQDTSLQPHQVLLQRAVEPISQWLTDAENHPPKGATSYWWVKAFACLAYPIMPDMAQAIWKSLGHDDEVSFARFLDTPEVGDLRHFDSLHMPQISGEDIAAMMPRPATAAPVVKHTNETSDNAEVLSVRA